MVNKNRNRLCKKTDCCAESLKTQHICESRCQLRYSPQLSLEIFDEALEKIRTLTHLQLLDLQKVLKE